MKAQIMEGAIRFYKCHLEGMGLSPQEFSEADYKRFVTGAPLLEHCLWMLGRMEELLKEEPPGIEKALGWMGFVQGCFAALQCFTVQELRDQSRS